MSENGKRRQWGASDKLRIVLAGMEPTVEVSELCCGEGLHPVQFYAWGNETGTRLVSRLQTQRPGRIETRAI